MRLDITVTDAQKDARNLDYICAALFYSGSHNDSSETKMQFLKRKILEQLRLWIRKGYSDALTDSEIPTE